MTLVSWASCQSQATRCGSTVQGGWARWACCPADVSITHSYANSFVARPKPSASYWLIVRLSARSDLLQKGPITTFRTAFRISLWVVPGFCRCLPVKNEQGCNWNEMRMKMFHGDRQLLTFTPLVPSLYTHRKCLELRPSFASPLHFCVVLPVHFADFKLGIWGRPRSSSKNLDGFGPWRCLGNTGRTMQECPGGAC